MIIDFRVRPPLGNPLDSAAAIDDFAGELRGHGIDKAVVMGRFLPAAPAGYAGDIRNDGINRLIARHPDLFVAFGSLDVRDVNGAIAEVDRLYDLGFRGISFDSAEFSIFDDDPKLFPIYNRIASRGMMLAFTCSALLGSSVEYSNPVHVEAVAQAFPETPVVVSHACWPWTAQAIGMLFQSFLRRNSRIYLMPDLYLHSNAPGRQDYIDALNWQGFWPPEMGSLADRFLFASSTPMQSLGSALAEFRALGLSEEIQQKVLYRNGAALLGLA